MVQHRVFEAPPMVRGGERHEGLLTTGELEHRWPRHG